MLFLHITENTLSDQSKTFDVHLVDSDEFEPDTRITLFAMSEDDALDLQTKLAAAINAHCTQECETLPA